MTPDEGCMLVVGAGFTGELIARRTADSEKFEVYATRTSDAGVAELQARGIKALKLSASNRELTATDVPDSPAVPDKANAPDSQGVVDETGVSAELLSLMKRLTHLVVCVGPSRESPLDDPVHRLLAPLLLQHCRHWRWMGYLSTIGVYGDHQGAWIDESARCLTEQTRSVMRLEAENAWQNTAVTYGAAISILRLSGIYGPGRNAVKDALAGRGRRLLKKDQVFNRIHVDDIATATLAAAAQLHNGILNITDNEPEASHRVVEYAHELVGREPPPIIDFESAELSPMARSFYSENKRVSNRRSCEELGIQYRYATYREGLSSEAARLASEESGRGVDS